MDIFCSNSDLGVIRNSGRLGSRFGARAILKAFKKLHLKEVINIIETSNLIEEKNNYEESLKQQSIKMSLYMKKNENLPFLHLGGGHDHVYSFLKAIKDKKALVLNIDPHCDTRAEDKLHSGTPFRKFLQEHPDWKGHLLQIGTSYCNNHDTTLEGLKKMSIFDYDALLNLSSNFTKKIDLSNVLEFMKIEDNFDSIFISLDADIIESSQMQAVSAVSYFGMPAGFLRFFLEQVFKDKRADYFGIYEYNPLYDDLSQKGARYLASLLYLFQTLR